MKKAAYKIETFPVSRLGTFDIGAVGLKKHRIAALVELDVTMARQKIMAAKKEGHNVSFNAWLIKCIALAVEEFKQLHGVRKGKRQAVLFDDVDISIMIEREIHGEKVPLPYVIRQANNKSIADIFFETKSGQQQTIENEGSYVLGENKDNKLMKLYYGLPGFARRLIWHYLMKNPFLLKESMGTVMVTSVGMVGSINGWVIPVSVHPLCLAVGSVMKKPGVVKDRIEIREYLYVTALVDHNVIDGAPAMRALSRLTELVERGYYLL